MLQLWRNQRLQLRRALPAGTRRRLRRGGERLVICRLNGLLNETAFIGVYLGRGRRSRSQVFTLELFPGGRQSTRNPNHWLLDECLGLNASVGGQFRRDSTPAGHRTGEVTGRYRANLQRGPIIESTQAE